MLPTEGEWDAMLLHSRESYYLTRTETVTALLVGSQLTWIGPGQTVTTVVLDLL